MRGLFESLTKIAAQPEKDFGDMVRERRRKRGLPVAPASKLLPFPPAEVQVAPSVDTLVTSVFDQAASPEDLYAAHVRLAEQRLVEAMVTLEHAVVACAPPSKVSQLEAIYEHELKTYERLHVSSDPACGPIDEIP